MTHIEGIAPPKKHKTVTQRRGAYTAHHEIQARARQVEQKILLIAGLTLVALMVVWALLLTHGGVLANSNSNSDKLFFNSLGEKLNTDFPVRALPGDTNTADTLFPSP